MRRQAQVGGSLDKTSQNWRRIVVYGPTGSGKTALARRVGELLDLPAVELDALFHRPNWRETPDDEFRAKVTAALDACPYGWVCDGNYTSKVGDIVLPRADVVVWLRPPFPVAFWRLLRRTVRRAWTKEPLWGTNHESWRLSFLSPDSILLWSITHWRQQFRNVAGVLREVPHRAAVFELRSTRDVNVFLTSYASALQESLKVLGTDAPQPPQLEAS